MTPVGGSHSGGTGRRGALGRGCEPGRDGAHGSRSAGTALLVVLEPKSERDTGTNAVLIAEAARLRDALGADLRAVTWEDDGEVDVASLADALAGVARGETAVAPPGGAAGEGPSEDAQGPLPAAILLADTDLGRQLAPMIADRLGSGAIIAASDVFVRPGESEDRPALSFVKPVYGSWLEREIEWAPSAVPVATLDLAGMPEPRSAPGRVPASEVVTATAGPTPAVRSLGLIPPDVRTVDLVHAKRIVAAGSGSAGEKLLAAARELADLLEGSVGATRPVVDDGLLPKERLIGQTGRTVSPELYLALGISGSPHHVAGVKKADKILSINRDVRAPIFQFSDVGYVGDLEEVLPALVERIKEYRDAPASAE